MKMKHEEMKSLRKSLAQASSDRGASGSSLHPPMGREAWQNRTNGPSPYSDSTPQKCVSRVRQHKTSLVSSPATELAKTTYNPNPFQTRISQLL